MVCGEVREVFQNAYKSKKIQRLIKKNAVIGKKKNGLDLEDNLQIAWEQVWKICNKFEGSNNEKRLLAYLRVSVPRKLERLKIRPDEEVLMDSDSIILLRGSESIVFTYVSVSKFFNSIECSDQKIHLDILTGNFEGDQFKYSASDESCAKLLNSGRSTFQKKKSFLRFKLKEILRC
ncbi:MAG: hypothetical protein ACO3L1_00030 [Flavobacteriaceae bacterium]